MKTMVERPALYGSHPFRVERALIYSTVHGGFLCTVVIPAETGAQDQVQVFKVMAYHCAGVLE